MEGLGSRWVKQGQGPGGAGARSMSGEPDQLLEK